MREAEQPELLYQTTRYEITEHVTNMRRRHAHPAASGSSIVGFRVLVLLLLLLLLHGVC
jgi:hypothetical protein